MLGYYKLNINYLADHAPDPDKRRYILKAEAPRHYLDLDHYGKYPFPDLPRKWKDAVEKFSEDSLNAHGIAPWWIQVMLGRLTKAFRDKNKEQVLKLSAEIGHYIADAHVPLHASSNHNGQYTNQHGIHGFWESRIPELLAEIEWDFFMEKAGYIEDPLGFMWDRMLESAAASDTVLLYERKLSERYAPDKKYAFENRSNLLVKQYSKAYSIQYNKMLKGMVERRMRQSVYAVASFWYTAWNNAGQPKLD
ncbi:MAG: zinc dependent phospholipase C family protein [Flavitalea sp.]